MRISTCCILALVVGLTVAAEKDLSGEESRDRRQNYNQFAASLGRPQSTAGSPTSHIPGKILEGNPFGVSPTQGLQQQHRFQTPQFLNQNAQGFRPQLNIPPGYGLGGPAYANIHQAAGAKEDREKEANALASLQGYPFQIFGGIPQQQQISTPSARPSPTPVHHVSTPRPALQSPSRGTPVIPSSRPTPAAIHASPRPTASYRQPDSDTDFQYQSPGVLAVPVSRPQSPARQQTRGPVRQHQQQQQRPQQVYRPQSLREDPELESEEEKEEPDRLSVLLQSSKFDCIGRNTGYYADVGLTCEVFHYCQDNQRHSWICPNGFTFHQVHLICMPPGSDNICQKSKEYHFVNDFLYKPLNAEAVLRNPNTTLKYADRYFPETHGDYESQQGPIQRIQAQPQSQPQQQQVSRRPVARPQSQQPSFGAGSGSYRQPVNNQAFHSPEEVNIPLSQRRPQPSRPNFQQYAAAPGGTEDYDYDESPYRGKK